MARRHRRTEEDIIIQTHFSKELSDMEILKKEALDQAEAKAKAVEERIKAEQERTKKKPFWQRTKEENQHAKRIEQASENLSKGGGE